MKYVWLCVVCVDGHVRLVMCMYVGMCMHVVIYACFVKVFGVFIICTTTI